MRSAAAFAPTSPCTALPAGQGHLCTDSLDEDNSVRILQVHNEYFSGRGGEDTVVDLEADLLRRHGHQVDRLTVSTAQLKDAGFLRLAAAAGGTVWSFSGYHAMKQAIARFAPDVIHAHNTFPLLSPSIFWAAKARTTPVVLTLHNFRLTCANASLFRDGRPCEQCVGHVPVPALRHRCYKRSLAGTAAVVCMNSLHRRLGTYRKKVDAYIALSEFSKAILVRSGLPPEKIFVKSNFTFDPSQAAVSRSPQMVFAGRVSSEKGPQLLLQAWNSIKPSGHKLLMFGDGPDREDLQGRYTGDGAVVWLGAQPRERVIAALASSRFLVVPSLLYENMPMVVLEALSVGTPVIAPNSGPFPELITHQKEGLLFTRGDADALAQALREGLKRSTEVWAEWSKNAREKYLSRFSDEYNYRQLIAIYERVLGNVRGVPA